MEQKFNNINGSLNTTGDVVVYGNVNGGINCGGDCKVYGKVLGNIKAVTYTNESKDKAHEDGGLKANAALYHSLMKKITGAIEEIHDTATTSIHENCNGGNNVMMCGDGNQSIVHNGNTIKSNNGIITINGTSFKGESLMIKNNEVYIDGKKVEGVNLK